MIKLVNHALVRAAVILAKRTLLGLSNILLTLERANKRPGRSTGVIRLIKITMQHEGGRRTQNHRGGFQTEMKRQSPKLRRAYVYELLGEELLLDRWELQRSLLLSWINVIARSRPLPGLTGNQFV